MVLANLGRFAGFVLALAAIAIVALWFVGGAGAPPSRYQGIDDKGYIAFYAKSDAEAARIEKKLTDEGYPLTDSVSTGILAGHTIIITRPISPADFNATIFKLSKDVGDDAWSLDTMQEQTYRADMSKGRYSFGRLFVLQLVDISTSAAKALLWVLALSAGAAALLALLLLARSMPSPAILWLGVGLGAWSLGVAYLWLYSIAPVFAAWQPAALSLRLLADTAAMLLILLACHAYIRFWKGFPQPVSDAELSRFLAKQKSEQMAKAGIAPGRAGEEDVVPSPAPVKPRWLWPALAILVTLCMGLSWTGVCVALFHRPYFAVPAFLIVIFFYVLLIYWPGITCLRVFRYHRVLGSAEDCRRIEWIRASIWLGFLAAVLPLCVLAVISIGDYFAPVFWDLEEPAKGLLIFGLSSGPLFVIIAVAISIFYKGTIDPRFALRQITLWSLVSVMLTLSFVLIERSVAVKVAEWAHLSPQTGYVTAGAAVAASFRPIRKRAEIFVNHLVEHALPGDKFPSGARPQRAAPVARSSYPGMAADDKQPSGSERADLRR